MVASGCSTWVATVRVSAGFHPNKMLPSLCTGGKRVCVWVCVRTETKGFRVASRLKKENIHWKRQKKWGYKGTRDQMKGTHRLGSTGALHTHVCSTKDTHHSGRSANGTHTRLHFCPLTDYTANTLRQQAVSPIPTTDRIHTWLNKKESWNIRRRKKYRFLEIYNHHQKHICAFRGTELCGDKRICCCIKQSTQLYFLLGVI